MKVPILVYQALRDADDQPVIEVFQQKYPSPQELVRYRPEYEMTSTLEVEGVIRAYSLEHFQHTFAIIFEDFGGEIVLSKLLEKMMWIVVENAGNVLILFNEAHVYRTENRTRQCTTFTF